MELTGKAQTIYLTVKYESCVIDLIFFPEQ